MRINYLKMSLIDFNELDVNNSNTNAQASNIFDLIQNISTAPSETKPDFNVDFNVDFGADFSQAATNNTHSDFDVDFNNNDFASDFSQVSNPNKLESLVPPTFSSQDSQSVFRFDEQEGHKLDNSQINGTTVIDEPTKETVTFSSSDDFAAQLQQDPNNNIFKAYSNDSHPPTPKQRQNNQQVIHEIPNLGQIEPTETTESHQQKEAQEVEEVTKENVEKESEQDVKTEVESEINNEVETVQETDVIQKEAQSVVESEVISNQEIKHVETINIPSELKCNYCNRLLNKPKLLLPCLHTFCEKCIVDMIEESKYLPQKYP